MFSGIEMKRWKKCFSFDNDTETLLRYKYSHKWYFPATLAMTVFLLLCFLAFLFYFFLLPKENQTVSAVYSILIGAFILCWTFFYILIQRKATSPYRDSSNGYLILDNKGITIKHVKNNKIKEYKYEDIKMIYFNKKTGALALTDQSDKVIFNELMNMEYVADALNTLYKTTGIKPKFK